MSVSDHQLIRNPTSTIPEDWDPASRSTLSQNRDLVSHDVLLLHFNQRHGGNVQGVHISSVLTNLRALKNTSHYLHICLHSSQTKCHFIAPTNELYLCKPDKYCYIYSLNLFKFFRITKKDNKTVCINPDARWINNFITKVMRR